jgi:hypothetical protein
MSYHDGIVIDTSGNVTIFYRVVYSLYRHIFASFDFERRFAIIPLLPYRGVAQLVARAVWDREVEGSSPFTPTTIKRLAFVGLFIVVRVETLKHSTSRSEGEGEKRPVGAPQGNVTDELCSSA